jgi:hypothetical protein
MPRAEEVTNLPAGAGGEEEEEEEDDEYRKMSFPAVSKFLLLCLSFDRKHT